MAQGFPTLGILFLRVPKIKAYSILGSKLGFRDFGKLPNPVASCASASTCRKTALIIIRFGPRGFQYLEHCKVTKKGLFLGALNPNPPNPKDYGILFGLLWKGDVGTSRSAGERAQVRSHAVPWQNYTIILIITTIIVVTSILITNSVIIPIITIIIPITTIISFVVIVIITKGTIPTGALLAAPSLICEVLAEH